MGAAEGAIQKAIMDALKDAGIMAIRVQSGLAKVRGGWMHLATPGTADILAFVKPGGRVVALEVKTAKGEARETQIAWAERLRAAGGHYALVRSVDDAFAAIEEAKRA